MLSWCPLLVVASLELQQNGEPCGRIGFYPQCYVCVVYVECFMFVHRVPLPGMETHIPVIFLNLKRMYHHFQNKICLTCFSSLQADISTLFFAADDLSSQDQFEVPEAGGWDAILNGEDEDDFFDLQIVKHYDSEVRV